ncbi:MAG: hypothetical protein Q8L21_01165 [Candidatus Komeilibacteria bacterium]|nr:hypothetical protein [Candidatus Komeilibacteria bacterium]
MNTIEKQPSEKSQIILNSLKQAVANALEKKRKLGQYAVIWEDNKLVYKGEDAPQIDSK